MSGNSRTPKIGRDLAIRGHLAVWHHPHRIIDPLVKTGSDNLGFMLIHNGPDKENMKRQANTLGHQSSVQKLGKFDVSPASKGLGVFKRWANKNSRYQGVNKGFHSWPVS